MHDGCQPAMKVPKGTGDIVEDPAPDRNPFVGGSDRNPFVGGSDRNPFCL